MTLPSSTRALQKVWTVEKDTQGSISILVAKQKHIISLYPLFNKSQVVLLLDLIHCIVGGFNRFI